MSAHLSPNFVQRDQSKNLLAISFRYLLGLYLIIPICILLQVVDVWFLDDYLLNNLPSSPNGFILFYILFGTPHIIASSILLVSNKEYITQFQGRVVWMSMVIAMVFGIGSLFLPYHVLYIIAASATVYHVLKQQLGICRGVCRMSERYFKLQLLLSVITGIFVYIGIFMKNSLSADSAGLVFDVSSVCCLLLLFCTAKIHKSVKSALGKSFLWSNTFLVVSSFYFYTQHYYFLAILVPRLVHDATAYIFYVTHDYNKHHQTPKNFLYQTAKKIKVHTFVVLPLLSFSLAFILQQYGDAWAETITEYIFGESFRKVISVGFIGYLGLMHYYTESFTWKGDSPYRQFIRFGN